ncbi:hypothetical protein CAAN1_14S01926 [[Candida] anglica]|uniref:Uncharacterized protein n=1 Tax=[Candida] anglica TaxID=148631 RepID=A0ABP0EKA8_9ASCO
MDQLDAKITQYIYAITKLQAYITSLRRLSVSLKESTSKNLPLIQYIVLLSGNVFSINDSLFNPRLESLSNFKLFKHTPLTISSIVSHIPYDTPDQQITSLAELPDIDRSIKCIKLLEAVSFNCLQAYQKRLQQAKVERSQSVENISTHIKTIEDIIKQVFDSENDLDISLTDKHTLLNLPSNPALLHNEDFIEATLIDMDVRMMFSVCTSFATTLNRLKSQHINTFQQLKKDPSQLGVDVSYPPQYSLHLIAALAIRTNELYTIFRKIGRKIYFSNYQHLYDQKLLFQSKNPNYFKLHLLKDMDETFNSTKKNGTLIATLTRFFRKGATYESNAKTALDFINFVNQGHMMLTGLLGKFEEFGYNWLAIELRFRKVYGLPKKILSDVYIEVNGTNKQPSTTAAPTQMGGNGSNVSSLESLAREGESTATEKERRLIAQAQIESDAVETNSDKPIIDSLDKLKIDTSSRTSSLSSISSTNSTTVMRRSSSRRNSLLSPQSTNGNGSSGSNAVANGNGSASSPLSNRSAGTLSRPASMVFLNPNNSLSSLQPPKHSDPTGGRRRSNSQPIRPSGGAPDAASAGAASALSRNSSINSTSSLRSPSGSIKRSTSLRASPSPKVNSTVPLISVEEEQLQQQPQLTANQRLQLHLKMAAKQGSLMTQQKETFTSVVFDPNSPSSVNLRRSSAPSAPVVPVEPIQSPSPVDSAAATPAAAAALTVPPSDARENSPSKPPPPQTRAQVTRLNTKRNSVHLSMPPAANDSISSGSSASSNESASGFTSASASIDAPSSPVKRVRFTGVPQYTEAEDAPTSYSSRILKNFAVFKTPSPSKKPGFKNKDQILKKEESISFRTQLRTEANGGFVLPPSNANPIGNAAPRGLGKLKKLL